MQEIRRATHNDHGGTDGHRAPQNEDDERQNCFVLRKQHKTKQLQGFATQHRAATR